MSFIAVLRQYYEAIGAVTARHEATLIRFAGDGVMVLVNAPVACENPAQRGIRLAIDMQAAVQSLARYLERRWLRHRFRRGYRDGTCDRRNARLSGTPRLHGDRKRRQSGVTALRVWRMTGRSWWIRLSPGMSRTASRLPPSESGPSRATIVRWRFLPSFAAAGRCRISAASYSLPTFRPVEAGFGRNASELSPADAFDPLKRDQGDERRSFLRQMPAEFGQQGCAPSEESFAKRSLAFAGIHFLVRQLAFQASTERHAW